jgi:hypothetical protein
MRDFFVFGYLARWVLAAILGLLLLAGIVVWRTWVVDQALADTTHPAALLPITTPVWGTAVPFQQWNSGLLYATPPPAPRRAARS